jgi:hypothetical protein
MASTNLAGMFHPQGSLEAAAILDFNQDGRNDIVVGSTGQPDSQLWLYAQYRIR